VAGENKIIYFRVKLKQELMFNTLQMFLLVTLKVIDVTSV